MDRLLLRGALDLLPGLKECGELGNEGVGLVDALGQAEMMVNSANNPARYWAIDTAEVQRWLDRGSDAPLAAIVHSHPGGDLTPSEMDITTMRMMNDAGMGVVGAIWVRSQDPGVVEWTLVVFTASESIAVGTETAIRTLVE